MTVHCSAIVAEVIVNWEQSQYTTREGNTISVCVTQTGSSETEFQVTLSSSDGPGTLPQSKMLATPITYLYFMSRRFQHRQPPVNIPC